MEKDLATAHMLYLGAAAHGNAKAQRRLTPAFIRKVLGKIDANGRGNRLGTADVMTG